jgi:hypothetical protein
MGLTTRLGPLAFRLAEVRNGVLNLEGVTPVSLLDDGTALARWIADDATYLVVDYRRYPETPARIEVWECTGEHPEAELRGLLALCDAAPTPGY